MAGYWGGETRKVTVIAATTSHTADQIKQDTGRLWGVVIGTMTADATVTIYNSSTNSNAIATITATSGNRPAPLSLDFYGVEFDKLSVGVSTAANLSIIYS